MPDDLRAQHGVPEWMSPWVQPSQRHISGSAQQHFIWNVREVLSSYNPNLGVS